MTITRSAKIFIAIMDLAALAMVAVMAAHGQAWHPYPALTLLAVSLGTSRMKVKLPGLEGNMSVNLPFLLLAVIAMNSMEAILIACAATMVQSLPKKGDKLKPVRMLFNASMAVVASGTAWLAFHASSLAQLHGASSQLPLIVATATFFLGQTVPVSIIVALTGGKAATRVWASIAQLTFPYYVASAGVTALSGPARHRPGFIAAVLLLAVMYGIYNSYKRYFAHAEPHSSQPLAMAAGAGH
jgi:hypothetical protein